MFVCDMHQIQHAGLHGKLGTLNPTLSPRALGCSPHHATDQVVRLAPYIYVCVCVCVCIYAYMPQMKYYGSHQDYASGTGHQGVIDLKNAHAYTTAPSATSRRRAQEADKTKGGQGQGPKAGPFWMTVFDAQRQKEHVFALGSEGERDEWLDVLLQTIDNYEVVFLCLHELSHHEDGGV